MLINFEDDNLKQEERPILAIAKITTAKGNKGASQFIATDTQNLCLNKLEEFITKK